ncbi:alanyl-tRNA editing protein [Haloimpatiens sp. FM7315]|uniref:alanyl-tRNA editing protein n=1 Tax=Haloimpatiens sp. FM7315 TaxID=3298609 RepID=UPI00370BC0EC
MEKLYYENQYEKNFTSEIINVIEKDTKFHIVLDKTYFYPGGGGQPSDTGSIESIPIIDVYEEDGIIYHVTEKKPIKIHKVKCSIEWESRFDNMQQHLGQHILSSCFLKLFNASTVGFHLGTKYCTIDIDKFLDIEKIQEAEKLSNEIVFENIPVEILYPSRSELKKMNLKKSPPNTKEKIRIVKIKDIDVNPCCGIHPNSTIEVQLIKVTKCEKHKSGTRIEFLCGKRALLDYFFKSNFAYEICNNLNCNENEVLTRVSNLTLDLKKINQENSSLKNQLLDFEVQNIITKCEKVKNISIIKFSYENKDLKEIDLLASKLTAFDNVIALLGLKSNTMANLIFMCSKSLKICDMGLLLKDTVTLIDGKGGGNSFSAKGGGKGVNNLDSALDYALMKVKGHIESK